MTSPLITVLMSVHNGRSFVGEAVDSVLGQTFPDFEFIIIDDGSTDGVTEDLERYAQKDDRIRLLAQENVGLARSLNRGLALARGKYIARMDGDDISHPHRFELQANALAADRELVLIGCEVELITEDGLSLGPKGQALDLREIRARLLHGDGSALVHPAVMFRREVANRIQGYDESFPYVQDLDFFLRMTEVGKAANLPETLLSWRQHARSINAMKSATWPEAKARAIEKAIDRIGVRAFSRQLFASEGGARFPNSSFELGVLAWSNGRRSEACRLYARELWHGPRRLRALKRLLFALPNGFVEKLSRGASRNRQPTARSGTRP